MLKFRTMIDGAEALLPAISARSITKGPIFKDPRDFRITPIGRILRKFSIDELPQLFNVIKGDMSLVGPRPLPVHESAAITGPYRRRFCMRPGITCLWQINGRSNVDYTTWMNYDLQYVDRWSLSMDARLLLKTIPAVLSRRGAY
jgi:lipopolysaccharide/colanic/teichoic acid biosynthesis glycosyltransferase